MEITEIVKTQKAARYTIKVADKLIKANKILEIIENLEDYIDKKGNIDKDSIKEDILNTRTHIVEVSEKGIICTCKNGLFRKTDCRHINFVREYLKNGKN